MSTLEAQVTHAAWDAAGDGYDPEEEAQCSSALAIRRARIEREQQEQEVEYGE